MFCHGSEEMAGSFGLHRRVGPGVIVVGYWVHVNYLRRGYATSGAQALTAAAFQLSDVGRVEIHAADENKASAATPRRLGCRLDRVEVRQPMPRPSPVGYRFGSGTRGQRG